MNPQPNPAASLPLNAVQFAYLNDHLKDKHVALRLSGSEASLVLGLVQLALRHRDLATKPHAPSVRLGRQFIETVAGMLAAGDDQVARLLDTIGHGPLWSEALA